MLFRNLGVPELLLILLLAFIIFGPNRVAKLGRELGQGIRAFQEGVRYDASCEAETSDALSEQAK